MNDARWREIDDVFQRAADLSDADRAAYLDTIGASTPTLAADVRRLLASMNQAPDYLRSMVDAAWEDEVPAVANQTLGPYRLIREIGRGGMGSVWLADRDDGQFRQKVAVKLIRGDMHHEEVVRGFLAERQILADLNHAHIARLLDGGATASGCPYLVMEYIEGVPLLDHCRQNSVTLCARLELFRTICEAVQHAHSKLVIHRDLKPGNILVTAAGDARVLDFGIAKLLDESSPDAQRQTQFRVFTPAYASPEQREGLPLSTATDIYSLGVILKELAAVGSGGLPDADIAAVIGKATREEPEQRYSTAEQLSDDVGRYLKGFPVRARPATLRYRAGKFVRRNRWAVTASIAAAIFLTGLFVQISLHNIRIQRERDKARQATLVLEDIIRRANPNAAGRPITVRELLDRSVERVRGEIQDPAIRAELEHAIGSAYASLGAYEQAASIFHPLAHQLRSLPAQEARLTDVLTENANALQMIGRHRQAETAASDAVSAAITQRHAPGGELRLAAAYNALCRARSRLAALDAAEAACMSALELFRRHPGEREGAHAGTLASLGTIHRRREQLVETEKLYAESLAIYRRLYSPPHARIASALYTLASVHLRTGHAEKAEPLLRESLGMYRQLYPASHPAVSSVLTDLGLAMLDLGKLDAAEASLVEAHVEFRKAQRGESADFAFSQGYLAQVYAWKGDYQRAQALLQKSLDLCAGRQELDVFGCSMLRAKLASTLVEAGQPTRGLALARESLLSLSAPSQERAFAQSVVALALVRLGRPAEAEKPARESLAGMSSISGRRSWRLSYAQLALGTALAAQAKAAEAAAFLDPARSFFASFGLPRQRHLEIIRSSHSYR